MKAIPIRVPSLAVEDPAYFFVVVPGPHPYTYIFFDVTYMFFERNIWWVQ